MENKGVAAFIKAEEGGNRNSKRSKRLIVEAYIELMKTYNAEKITVTKIVELADLNRSTFYAHFGCPEDVYTYIEKNAVSRLVEYIDEVPLKGRISDPKPLLDRVISFIEENVSAINALINTNRATKFIEYVKDVIIERFMSDTQVLTIADKKKFEVSIRFCIGGMTELLNDSFTNKIDIPLSELSDSMAEIIHMHMERFIQ